MSHNRSAVAVPAAWYEELCGKLCGFSSLKSGWNGLEAEPPNDGAIALAGRVLRVLHDMGFRPTRIDASAEGGVGFMAISSASTPARFWRQPLTASMNRSSG